jgi:hypothetical protein
MKAKVQTFHDGQTKVLSKSEHDHSSCNDQVNGLPQHLKAKLHTGINQGKRPRDQFEDFLLKDKDAKVTLKQIQQAHHRLRKKVLSDLPEASVGFLHQYLASNELTLQSGLDEVGVLPGWRANGPKDIEDAASDIIFGLTSKRLLKQAVDQAGGPNCSFIMLDGTYKLTIHGYPTLIIGTMDSNHQFKVLAIFFSRKEDTLAYIDALQKVKNAIQYFFEFDWSPRQSMSDSAGAILNALVQVFPDIIQAVCYFHLKKGLKDHKPCFSSEENFEMFGADVESLSNFGEEEMFDEALSLFQIKWEKKEKVATEWIMREWGTGTNRRWFAGATEAGLPRVNNSLENYNRILKCFVTKKERQQLGFFIRKVTKELKYQTILAYREPFKVSVSMGKQLWGKSQLWARDTKKWLLKGRCENFFAPSANTKLLLNSNNTLKQHFDLYKVSQLSLASEKFAQYVSRVSSFYQLKLLQQPNESNFYSCTCVNYLKDAVCKHSLGNSLLQKKTQCPPQWVVNTLEELRKKGRPPKASASLMKQKL